VAGERQEKLIREFIDRMPSLPTTVTKVLEICNQPDTSPNDLNRVIYLDPVLTGQVLRLINSAYYSLPNQIGSLTRAIIMLGINTVKNLTLSTAVLGSMGRTDSFRALDMDQFWTHSLGVGVTAKSLAARRGIVRQQREEFFVAGLLHDLGKIPLNACFPEEYGRILELAAGKRVPLDRVEVAVLGLDHCRVGRMIGEKWQLSSGLVELLAGHHHIVEADRESPAGEKSALIGLVSLADSYVNLLGLGSAGNRYPDREALKILARTWGVNKQTLTELDSEVRQEIEKARIFLAVAAAS